MATNNLDILLKEYVKQELNSPTYLLKCQKGINHSDSTLKGFEKVVYEIEDLYPGIDKWFIKKVQPGLKNGTRYAYLIMHNDKVIGETIVKPGNKTKICSLRIIPEFQNRSMGLVLFAKIAKSLDFNSNFIHFTAPESLVVERKGLFNNLGFHYKGLAKKKYRNDEDEFVFQAEVNLFRRRAITLFYERSNFQSNFERENNSLVMSIRPMFAFNIVKKRKTVEIRRRFSNKIKGNIVYLYATQPTGSVVGEATVANVLEEKPGTIWDNYKDKIGGTWEEYCQYCKGADKVKAIFFENIIEYNNPLPWRVFSTAYNISQRPPQSYQYINSEESEKEVLGRKI